RRLERLCCPQLHRREILRKQKTFRKTSALRFLICRTRRRLLLGHSIRRLRNLLSISRRERERVRKRKSEHDGNGSSQTEKRALYLRRHRLRCHRLAT